MTTIDRAIASVKSAVESPYAYAFGVLPPIGKSELPHRLVLLHMGYTSAYFKIVNLTGITLPSFLYAAKNIPWVAAIGGAFRIVRAYQGIQHSSYLYPIRKNRFYSEFARGVGELVGFGLALLIADAVVTLFRKRLANWEPSTTPSSNNVRYNTSAFGSPRSILTPLSGLTEERLTASASKYQGD
ncbi:MAG: hypothetical protein H0X51_09620 [Parachlamydiaceae bacterium]|nr:hypothetical protein [Parachlamydiaceae bacterium]